MMAIVIVVAATLFDQEEIEKYVGKTRKLSIWETLMCVTIGCTPVSRIGTRIEIGGLVKRSSREGDAVGSSSASASSASSPKKWIAEGGRELFAQFAAVEFDESYFEIKEEDTERHFSSGVSSTVPVELYALTGK